MTSRGAAVKWEYFQSGKVAHVRSTDMSDYDGRGYIATVRHIEDAPLVAAAPELCEALEGLFKHCAMIHKHWGEGSNAQEADKAIKFAQSALSKARGGK